MKDSTMKLMVQLASDEAGPISTITNSSVEQGIVLVSKLEPALKEAGYDIQYTDKTNGAWCKVYLVDREVELGLHQAVLKAQGYSHDRQSALLHAAWGAVREENAAHKVNSKLKEAGIEVDQELRQKLESVHILEGPDKVDQHLQAFQELKK